MMRLNRSRAIKIIFLSYIMLMTMLVGTVLAEGEDYSDVESYIVDKAEVDENGDIQYSSTVNDILNMYPYDEMAEGNKTLTVSVDDKTEILQLSPEAYEKLQGMADRSQDTARVQSKLNDMNTDFDISADMETAGDSLSGLRQPVSWAVGIIVYLVVLGMVLYTALDICYISMPAFRNKADEAVQRGGNMVSRVDNKTGEASHRWITQDAQYAVQQATLDSGKSPYGIYLGKRIWSYIMLAVVIYILLTGNLSLIINIVIKIISGLMGVLSGLAG